MSAYLLITPAVIVLGGFVIAPIIYAFYLSLFRYDLLDPAATRFVGLGNFVRAWQDPVFWIALKNILIYALGVVPTQVVVALILALMVNTGVRGQGFFRAVYFIPTVTSSVATSHMFLYIYSNTGLLNWLARGMGLPTYNWMQDARTALPAIMAMNIWSTVGQLMVVFLAGLQEVPESLYEAAKVDGATYWRRFRHVTLPLIKPATMFTVIMSVIGTLQVFDQMYLMSGGLGGPNNATMTMVLYIWRNAMGGYFRMGYGAALAVVLFVVIMVLTAVQKRWFGEEVQS